MRPDHQRESAMNCPSCSNAAPEDARFCPQCGAALSGQADIAPESSDPMPAGEAAAELKPPRKFLAERRIATVMFADISGFTSFSETTDPEHLRDLINSCFRHLVPIILEHGGQIDKFIGDEIMALFGATQANEDDAPRALEAALKMMDAMVDFSRDHGLPWNLHVGINTGLVVAGMVGSDAGQKFSVIGDAVNVASRLVGQAKPGEILVGESTFRLTRDEFAFETIAGVTLKGKSTPVTLYRLMARGGERPAGLPAPIRAPLLGRADEVVALDALLNGLQAGQAFILVMSGEAGVGKSRLLTEIRSASRLRWLEGKSVPMGRAISYWPFIQILREIFGIDDTSSEAQSVESAESGMRRLFPAEHQELTPYIAQLLSIRLPKDKETRLESMSAENLHFLIYRSVHRLFRRIAQDGPLVIVFEDVHWADQSSLDMIEHIASLVTEVPIGLVIVERIEEAGRNLSLKQHLSDRFPGHYRSIKLAPLPQDASRRLCEALLDVEEFKLAPVIEMVVDRSEGNPFFLEEMLRALIDMKMLSYDARTRDWKVEGERMQIPDSLSAVVLSRLDRLEDGLRDIIKYASVVGRSFLFRILLEMKKDNSSLENYLMQLLQIEIIREKINRHDREYIFKHALYQKITYESILKQERKELHKHVAEIIEILFTNRLDEFVGLLAYHYTQAEDWKKAHEYLLKAGEKADRMGADTEALELYHQTLGTYQKAFGQQIAPFEAAVMQRKMGEALFRKGQHHLAEEYLNRALDYFKKKPPVGQTRIRLGILRNILRQAANRLFLQHRRPPRDSQFSAEKLEVIRIRKALGFMYFFTNRELYLLNTISGLNEAEQSGSSENMLDGLLAFGVVLTVNGLFSLADMYFTIAAGVVSRLKSEYGMYYHLTAYHEDCKCNWTKAIQFYDKAIALYRDCAEVKLWASAACLRVELSLRTGEKHGLAMQLAREVHEMGRESGDRQLLAWGLGSIALVMSEAGQLFEAISHLEEALPLLAAIPDHYILLCSYCHLADCRIRQGEWDKAMLVVEKGAALIDARGLVGPFVTRLKLKQAQAWMMKYGAKPAQTTLARAEQFCLAALRSARKFRAFLPEAHLHRARLQFLSGRGRPDKTVGLAVALALNQGNRLALRRLDWVKESGLLERHPSLRETFAAMDIEC